MKNVLDFAYGALTTLLTGIVVGVVAGFCAGVTLTFTFMVL